jgi:hypothetical protein
MLYKIELKKPNDTSFMSTGGAVLYKENMEYSETDDFETMARKLIKKHKYNATEMLANCVFLNYQIDKANQKIYIVLHRSIDNNNFSKYMNLYLDLIRYKFSK